MGCLSCAGFVKGMAGTATRLVLRDHSDRHIGAECLNPEFLAGRNAKEISSLQIRMDGETGSLGDVFFIEPGLTEHVVLEGDLSRVHDIGKSMRHGTLTVQGNVGDRLGAGMQGGVITVEGSAGDNAGAEMNGGTLLIKGHAGTKLGSAMRRGMVAVQGDTGDCPGDAMEDGTIFVFGRLGNRAGAGNRRGTIVAHGPVGAMLPTYMPSCTYASMRLSQACAWLRERGFSIPGDLESGIYLRHRGDMNMNGKGEILVFCKSQ